MYKKKTVIFEGSHIRKLVKDPHFIEVLNYTESRAWTSYNLVIQNVFGNRKKSSKYRQLVGELMQNYGELGTYMSIKSRFLQSHLEDFLENLGDVSDKQISDERFHQDIKVMEERYQGHWDKKIMADYCWSLKWDKS